MMKMVTAEFDWYTFLIIALGIVLGLAKNKKKKTPVLSEEEEITMPEEEVVLAEEKKPIVQEIPKPAALSKERVQFVPKTTPHAAPENEEEEEEGAGIEFDLRQAVIGSEILNRPRSLYPDV